MNTYARPWLLVYLWLCGAVAASVSTSLAAGPADGRGTIELTQVDDHAIAYATFQSHNQKVVSTERGIFITYLRSAAADYQAQTWRLAHSTDRGRSFSTVLEETRATNPPVLESDRAGNLYLTRPDFADGNAYVTRLSATQAEPVQTTLPTGAAGKYCQLFDEARQRLYYFAHNGTFHVVAADGRVLSSTQLLVAGPQAVTQYPHLTLDKDGALYAAWTTNILNGYLYRSIQAIKSPDGGETWLTLDNAPLTIPMVSDDTGPTTRISRDDELEVHSWLSSLLVKDGKLHLVYWAATRPERQWYQRYDGNTGKQEIAVERIMANDEQQKPNDSGVLVTDQASPDGPLYFVSTLDNRRRLACLVSEDQGATWREFAVSDHVFAQRVYSIGAARTLTRDGEIIGTFTDVADPQSDYTTPNSGTVYFFRIATRPAARPAIGQPRYKIDTIAGNGQPGDTPPGAQARDVPVDLPFGVEYGPDGALYITAIGSHRVLRMDAGGKMTQVAGNGKAGYAGDGDAAQQAVLNEPYEVRFDSRGNMLILCMRNHVLRRVEAGSGIITTIAGDGTAGDRGDGGPATMARLNYPHSMTLDEHDNIYIGDIMNHRVRRIDAASGRIETVVGNGRDENPLDGGLAREQPLATPQGLGIYKGGLWLSSYRLHRIWRVDLESGVIRHVAGTGERGHSGDGGDPLRATLDGPRGMKISPDGILYLAEGENNIIRAYDIERNSIHTIAGAGPTEHAYTGDGVLATTAPIWQPHGIAIGVDGSLVISDTLNHRVRKLIPISTE